MTDTQARVQAVNGVATELRDKQVVRIIPFDYVASFDLKGEVGRLHEDVINISVEGVFVAVAVGYGLQADTAAAILVGGDRTLQDVTLADVPPHALMDGFRVNPALEPVAFPGDGPLDLALEVSTANRLGVFQTLRPVQHFSFLFNVVDTGSGRELQNLPVHNIAGLGKENGERPFRMLGKPLAFLPRSSVRLQVEEQSRCVKGRLYIALHGYKILGAAGIAEEQLRVLYRKAMQRFGLSLASDRTIRMIEGGVVPSNRLVPFDYVATVDLLGRPGRIAETEVNINIEGGFVASSIGYSLRVDDSNVQIVLDSGIGPGDDVDVRTIRLSDFPSDVLKEGFRIRRSLLRLAFANGQLNTLPRVTVERLFEPLNLPDRVNFLYSIVDTGSGREWQNEPVHNVAGLGIADGDRPFRNLAWPMDFLPRSTIRLRIEEVFGRGRLYVDFQGYKKLGFL